MTLIRVVKSVLKVIFEHSQEVHKVWETPKYRKKESVLSGTRIQIEMPSYSQSSTQVPFIITSWSFQSLLSAVEIRKLKWVCASWVLQSMKMCLYAYICWGCQDWHLKTLLREGPTHSCTRKHTCNHTGLDVFSFLCRYLSVHWLHFFCPTNKHTYYIYSGGSGSFIMSLTLRKKPQHKHEYFWKLNLTEWPQKALEDSRDVSADAVKLIDLRVRSP